MSRTQKLELNWIGKDERPRLEPRILLEQPELSYHARHRVSETDRFDNLLIHGDNLLALKALEQAFRGQVKCIFIDPPYNTGSAFTHYDDGLEHSLWLSMMRDRLELLRELLSPDGSIWITIDDNEAHYLKVLCDQIFGRSNFLACVIWNHSVQSKGYSGKFSVHHNYVLCYQKTSSFALLNLPRQEQHNVNYSNPDDDPRGAWRSGDVRNSLVRRNLMYDIETPSGKLIRHPPKGWRFSRATFERELAEGKIVFSDDETRIIRKIYLADQQGRVPESLWFPSDVGTTREANAEVRTFVEGDFFDTPKPERLIERVLLLATEHGDLVLDSFAGSGTTGAVAHKMGRRWIMVELGEHCHTHIVPRLRKVIDGEDPGGVTAATDWKGGGGFRYYRLAPSLLREDAFDNLVINPEYQPEMLAEAVCKLMGYTYAPSDRHYWQHGQASESDFLYVTTASLTHEQLRALSEDVGEDRTLLICCKAFRADPDAFPNLTIQKIPQTVLQRCEWGRDDYSLRIAELPPAPEPDQAEPKAAQPKTGRKSKPAKGTTGDLFAPGDKS